MPKFIYKAKKNPKEVIEGEITADNKNIAIQKVSRMGYYLLSIKEEKEEAVSPGENINIFREKVGLVDISNFTRQLSDLLESGLTIVHALDVLYNQTESKKFKRIILDIKNFCIDGNPLSSALARHPKVFSNLFVSMVKSGETGGVLGTILIRLADFNDKQLEMQTKLKSALAYPILMSFVGCITIIVLFTFVIPKMMAMFSDLGQNLPLPTQILIGITNIIRNYWWLVISVIVFLFFVFRRVYKTGEGKYRIDGLKLKIPLFGNLFKKVEIAGLSRTLATLLNNGVPILESLNVVSEAIDNAVIKDEIIKAASSVKDGSNMASGFSKKGSVIPPLVINMIAVGEEGGQLEKALFKIAEGFERESDTAMKVMMSLLEPVLILVLGAIVGFVVISMLLPIFEIDFLAR